MQSARKPYVPGVREPMSLPNKKIELPAPSRLNGSPPTINWITALLPSLLIIVGMVVISIIQGKANLAVILPSMVMTVGFPIANLIGHIVQKNDYKKKIIQRENDYKTKLEKEKNRLHMLTQEQRNALETEYPRVSRVVELGISRGRKERLWWRRRQDSDFLALRIGKSKGEPSFSVSAPNFSDPFDPLAQLPQQIVDEFREIADLPFLVDLKKVGSIAIASPSSVVQYKVVYRLIADLVVHHSPQDIHLAVLSDRDDATEKWSWLKWLPHTRSLDKDEKIQRIAFRPVPINDYLHSLNGEYRARLEQEQRFTTDLGEENAAIVVIFDDRGRYRQQADLSPIIKNGREAEIYLVFIGEEKLPQVRARLDVSEQESFRYVETWEDGRKLRGQVEFLDFLDMEGIARSQAMLELMGEKSNIALPESVRLTDVISSSPINLDSSKQNWSIQRSERELLQFPIGIYVERDGLTPAMMNLLPAERGGYDAYHSILIGTTGSGKSEFMKSIVLAAAYQYSPLLLNFFFMDFKGGAAFNLFAKLPHVAGIVTNLKPELVERGLDAVESEIARRQEKFSEAGVRDIWSYNKEFTVTPIPHLILFLDEFAKGLEDFPRLPDILQLLVRQGRSLGMYLMLANQDVNPSVDSLLNNVGWRIALKVARQEEMSIIDKNLRPARRAGHGYLRTLNGDIFEFQSGYGGHIVLNQANQNIMDFIIFAVGPDGKCEPIYKHNQESEDSHSLGQSTEIEQDVLLKEMDNTATDLGIKAVRRIYLDPLATEISLESVIQNTTCFRRFNGQHWTGISTFKNRLKVPIGYLDFPKECIQQALAVNFNQKDGHLWISGSPGSGKALTLNSILFSLAYTHNPEDINIYILEFGAGTLRTFETMPHVGSVIRSNEKERIERLLNYLDQEMDIRTREGDSPEAFTEEKQDTDVTMMVSLKPNRPTIFLVINNFAELKTEYPDSIDQIARFVRDGKSAGIHLIITSNRGVEVLRNVSTNISRRIVLQMASKDEYADIVGVGRMPTIAARSPGRGVWVSDDSVVEFQVAQPTVILQKDESLHDYRAIIAMMQERWKGAKPQSIGIMPSCYPLDQALKTMEQTRPVGAPVPVGIAYESLDLLIPDLLSEVQHWLILGRIQSGKSNFLACMAASILNLQDPNWIIKVFCFRKSSIPNLLRENSQLSIFTKMDTMLTEIQALTNTPQLLGEGKKLLLLMDDLGAVFETGRDKLKQLIEELGSKLRDQTDVYLAASSTVDDLRTVQSSSSIVKLLRQSMTGISFVNDSMVLDWLGVQATPALMRYRRIDFLPGRAFFVSRGKPILVQTPRVDQCPPTKLY